MLSRLTDQETEALKWAAFDRADTNSDGLVEATEILDMYNAVGKQLTEMEIFELMETSRMAYEQLKHKEAAENGVPRINGHEAQLEHTPRDVMACKFEHFHAYPSLFPSEYLEQTLAEHLKNAKPEIPAKPSIKKGKSIKKKDKAQGSMFTYVHKDHKPLRHAVVVGIDRYSDKRLAPNSHCVVDAVALGQKLECLGYSVELIVNDMDNGRQPTKKTILDTLACASDRDSDSLLVYFAGYWMNAPLLLPGKRQDLLSHFALCYDTGIGQFTPDTVLTIEEIRKAASSATGEYETVIVIDGLQPGYMHTARGEGFSIISYASHEVITHSLMKFRSLLSHYLIKGLNGAAEHPGHEEGVITIGSLHRYLGVKMSKHTYGGTPQIPDDADQMVLSDIVLHSHYSETHPRQYLIEQSCKFLAECGFSEKVAFEDFESTFMEVLQAHDPNGSHKALRVKAYPCKVVEFLLPCSIDDVTCPTMQLKLKQEIEKMADENPWVQMRSDGGEGRRGGSTLKWTCTVATGLDHASPGVMLTIATGSTESVGKLRAKYMSKRLSEWMGYPILWMRQRVRFECTGTEYDRLKLDCMGRVGAWLPARQVAKTPSPEPTRPRRRSIIPESVSPPPQPSGPPGIHLYNVAAVQDTEWKPKTLPLRKFNLLTEPQFANLCDGMPMLIQFCGKKEPPEATISNAQLLAHNALRELYSEGHFNNKIRFFQYEMDHVVYPKYVVSRLSRYFPCRGEDEIIIVYHKFDRAFTLGIDPKATRISATKLRSFCAAFLEGTAERLHDGTCKALRPKGLPKEHEGVLVIGCNNFDRLVFSPAHDVLVLYHNANANLHQQDRLTAAVQSFARLGDILSKHQEEDQDIPQLLIVSDDNNERFFFPEHHLDATVSIPKPRPPSAPILGPTARRTMQVERPSSPSAEDQAKIPAFTIRLFPANEAAKKTGCDYWTEVFEKGVQQCKTFFGSAHSPVNVSDFIEKNTDWAPKVIMRVEMGQTIKLASEAPPEEALPSIFKGL